MKKRWFLIGLMAFAVPVAAWLVDRVVFDVWQRGVFRSYHELKTLSGGSALIPWSGMARPDAVRIDNGGGVSLAFYPPALAWVHRRNEEVLNDSSFLITISVCGGDGRKVVLHHGSD